MKEQSFIFAAVIIKENKILLLHRNINHYVWEFPGGGIEFGESPEDAAVREAKEECRLKVKSKYLLTISSYVTPQNRHHIGIYYKCDIISGNAKVCDDEHDGYGWFTLKEIKKLSDLALSVKLILPFLKKCIGG